MARRKLIYTYRKDNKNYIVDRKTFVKILAEEVYYDTTNYGWFGIDSANYEEGERKAKWLARTGTCLMTDDYSFRVFTEEQFQRHTQAFKDKYIDLRGEQ